MNHVETSVTAQGRIKGMIAMRDCVRDAHRIPDRGLQRRDDPGTAAKTEPPVRCLYRQIRAYSTAAANNMAFSDDSSYCLLCSLEVLDENGELERKADMFTKRTIRQRTAVTHVDTATEALAISIAEKACVDMGFMQSLTGLIRGTACSRPAGRHLPRSWGTRPANVSESLF